MDTNDLHQLEHARPEDAEPPRERGARTVTALLIALAFGLGFAEFVMIGIVPDVSAALGEPLTLIGDLVGYYALACAVATPLITLATGRLKRRTLFIALLIVFSCGNALTLFAETYVLLAVSRMMAACTSGALLALSMTFVPRIVGKRRAPVVISFVLAGFTVASVIGVPLATTMSDIFDWKAVYLIVFLLGLVVSLALVPALPVDGATNMPTTARAQMRLLGDARILVAVCTILLGASATYVFYTYLTPVLETIMGFAAWQASAALLVFGAAGAASNILSGLVAQRIGIKALPFTFLAHACLLALLSVSVFSSVLGMANIVAVCLLMYVMNSTVQMLFLNTAEQDYPHAMTFASSLHPMSFNAGIAIGSFAGGAVVNTAGLLATGPAGALFAGTAALASVVLIRVAHCRKIETAAPQTASS